MAPALATARLMDPTWGLAAASVPVQPPARGLSFGGTEASLSGRSRCWGHGGQGGRAGCWPLAEGRPNPHPGGNQTCHPSAHKGSPLGLGID